MWELSCGYYSDSEPGSENYSLTYGSLSPKAPLVSPEGSVVDFNERKRKSLLSDLNLEQDSTTLNEEIVMTVVLNNGTLQVEKNEDIGKKRDSSDSGKESDTEEEIEERKDIEENSDCEDVYEDCEVYEEEEDIDECVNDYQEKSDYSWNYLQTIEEEEEELLEDEEEVEEEDSGNDSDLEKSELETFEQLEQMCEEEANKEEGGINERGTIISFSAYKKVKEKCNNNDNHEYEEQIIVEKDNKGVKLKCIDSKEGGKEESIGVASDVLRELANVMINKSLVGAEQGMKHDPDTKIKSALKRGASSKKRKKYKVQFDESLNKFFEADYVILIREECGGGNCECGGGGGGDYCYGDDDEDEDEEELQGLDLTPFDPPVEFVDQLTLSPPDGYKDYCIHRTSPDEEQTHQSVEQREDLQNEGSNEEPPRTTIKWKDGTSSPPRLEDGTTQTTPTSEGELDDTSSTTPPPPEVPEKKERYIVETITMTTVTERRIIRETASTDSPPPAEPAVRTSSSTSTTHGIGTDNEMTLTFKLGSNSLKPNSALRQLFPRIASPPPDKSPDSDDDSLQSNLIKRTIERNTLRRSLVRYPDLRKRNQAKKNENSLVERIKKLTCDIDEEERSSPTGEESKEECNKVPAYRKITDMFIRGSNKEPHPVVLQTPPSLDHQYPYYQPYNPPDLGNGLHKPRINEGRKQFLSSLAPLAACVTSNPEPCSRDSVSSAGTEYSLGDIDVGLSETASNVNNLPAHIQHSQSCPVNNVHQQLSPPQIAQQPPDVVVGTPGTEADELALFVQRDASRIDRLRKRYSPSSDDDQDDYGFNRRPSVRGIKPRFGSTTEILQQMQSQMTPPLPSGSHVSWPYYPEEQRNGYRRYVDEPHYSQNIIHVQQGQSVRLPYQSGPVQVHVMGPSRQVVVRGTQTISTYYQLPRPALRNSPTPGPLLYYPRPPVACGSPTKGQLELRGVPEGASAPAISHHEVSGPAGGILAQSAELAPPHHHHGSTTSTPTPPMMYAMNV